MGRIIRMPGAAHREVQELLPWYVTDQLDATDRAEVEHHLKTCAECRAEVGFQQQLAGEITQLPMDVEHGWARMRRRLEEEDRKGPAAWFARLGRALQAPVGRSALAPAALATVAVLVLGGIAVVSPVLGPAQYHALGATPPAVGGNVVVIFKPDTPEKALRDTLRLCHARLVDGPTAADGYVLRVAPGDRDRILAQLRGRPEIVLAEPVDPAQAP